MIYSFVSHHYVASLFFYCALVCSINGFTINVDPPSRAIVVKEGNSMQFICKANKTPVEYCIVRTPQKTSLNLKPDEPNDRYKYAGNGYTAGDCGLKIESVTKMDDGIFECKLGVAGESEGEFSTVNVTVANSPSEPELELDKGQYREGETVTASCVIANARPAATDIKWFLDNELIKPDTIKETPGSDTSDSFKTFTVESTYSRKVYQNDSGRILQCKASHISWNSPEASEEKEIDVEFKATLFENKAQDLNHRIDPSKDREYAVIVKFTVNPIYKDITWTIGEMSIKEAHSNSFYQALNVVPLGERKYKAELRLLNITPDFTDLTYRLIVKNKVGESSFKGQLYINAPPEPEPEPKPEPEPETPGDNTGLIVGIVIGIIALVLLLIGGLFVVKRRFLTNFKL